MGPGVAPLRTVREAGAIGFDALRRAHVAAWRRFWNASAVSLPEPDLERLWYLGVYLLASSARRGMPPPGLQGLWPMDGVPPPWRGDYHADMNVQETLWPAAATDHLELLDVWCDHMHRNIGRARAFTRRFFGTEGTFWPCCTIPDLVTVPCWYTAQFGWSHTGWLAWLVWLRWRYSMDKQWLRDTGYPVVAEVFRFYRANLERGRDGRLHVPLSCSPEYGSDDPRAFCRDPNVDLALIRRCCDWVVEMETAAGRRALSASARALRGRLAPYALTTHKALCLWPGKPLDESHRHPSHLMAIHPGMDLTVDDGPEPRAIIEASVAQYLALGQWGWAGHTYAQLTGFAAALGRADWAYDSLRRFHDYWVGPNGLHFNADLRNSGLSAFGYMAAPGAVTPFTMEANQGVAAGICDMLVQGWRDVVRVFPAVPDRWRDVSFRDLRCEGAFRVSAVRRDGRTVWVRIVAGRSRRLRLRNPFGLDEVSIRGAAVRRRGDILLADLQLQAAAGELTEEALARVDRHMVDQQEASR